MYLSIERSSRPHSTPCIAAATLSAVRPIKTATGLCSVSTVLARWSAGALCGLQQARRRVNTRFSSQERRLVRVHSDRGFQIFEYIFSHRHTSRYDSLFYHRGRKSKRKQQLRHLINRCAVSSIISCRIKISLQSVAGFHWWLAFSVRWGADADFPATVRDYLRCPPTDRRCRERRCRSGRDRAAPVQSACITPAASECALPDGVACCNRSANALREEENTVVAVQSMAVTVPLRQKARSAACSIFGVTSSGRQSPGYCTARAGRSRVRRCKFGAVIQQRFVDMVADAGNSTASWLLIGRLLWENTGLLRQRLPHGEAIAVSTSFSVLKYEKLKRTAPAATVQSACMRGAQCAPARVAMS